MEIKYSYETFDLYKNTSKGLTVRDIFLIRELFFLELLIRKLS